MGRGSKHSKNAGGMGTEGLTYHERKALGYGTLKERLGKDAQGNFYDCCLTLQPATDPMITSQGYIFSKEAILDYFLTQKELKKKQLKEWEQQQQAEVDLASKAAQIEEAAKLELFERQNIAGASDHATEQATAAAKQSKEELYAPSQGEASGFTVKANEKRAKETKPQHTPSSSLMATKPSMHVLCPVTSKKLRMKDLTPIKFTPTSDGATNSFMDPVSNDMLNNSSTLVAIKATGDVMLEKTYKTCIKPDGIYKGCKIAEKDVIKLQTGGSGFAGGKQSDKLQSDKSFMLGPGSGKADLRGQAAGGASRFGLSFMN